MEVSRLLGLPRPLATHGHLPGLDALRAFAVLAVIVFHRQLFDAGWIGVQVFFVLSGYLITRSLYFARKEPLGRYLGTFYGRRSLRIFPLYYATLLVIWLAVAAGFRFSEGVRPGLLYAFTYTYNIYAASPDFQHTKLLGHFWTLAVEEQFYLVWPFLIYFCPERFLGRGLLATILLGPVLHALTYFFGHDLGLPMDARSAAATVVLAPSQVDAFAFGAWAALFPPEATRRQVGAIGAVTLGSALIFLTFGSVTWHSFGFLAPLDQGYGFIWQVTLLNCAAALAIDCVVHERLFPRFLENPVLNRMGAISYGAYVFHFPLQGLVDRVVPSIWPEPLPLFIEIALTFAVASASYRFFESPLLALKKYFPTSDPSKRVSEETVPPDPVAQPAFEPPESVKRPPAQRTSRR